LRLCPVEAMMARSSDMSRKTEQTRTVEQQHGQAEP
jgi:hypothetical protein